jgi:hypothetical protein
LRLTAERWSHRPDRLTTWIVPALTLLLPLVMGDKPGLGI